MTVTNVGGWLTGSLPDDTGREWPVVQRRQESARGPLQVPVPNLILHTTETDRYLDVLRFPSQWQCGEGQIGQHIRLGLAGDAVNDWDTHAQQIEMVGRSQVGRWLPEEATTGPTVALTAWLHDQGLIKTGLKRPTQAWPVSVDQLPAAVESYYRRHAGLWPAAPGVYGHIEIPGNSHWDPGGFDYPRFFARVQTVLLGGDMTDAEKAQLARAVAVANGVDDFLADKAPPADAHPQRKQTFLALKSAAATPLPGTPAGALRPGDVVKLVKP